MGVNTAIAESKCHLPDSLRRRLGWMSAQQATLEGAFKLVVEAVIRECHHPLDLIKELPPDNGKPWLICCGCGLTEQGWYCGYNLLKHAEYAGCQAISLDEWFATRTKSVFQDGSVVVRSR